MALLAWPWRTGRFGRVGLGVLTSALLAGCSTLPLWMVVQQQSQITDYRHFDNAPIARSSQPMPWPVAPGPPLALRWPDGQDTAANEADAARRGTVALLMARRGQIVYERYFNGFDAQSLGTSFSMAKSVVSLLLGIAIDDGRIASVDEPITRYLPELRRNDTRFDRITLRHLLMMRSGIAFDEGYRSPFAEAAKFYLTDDLPQQVAQLRIAGEPDQAYDYKSGDTQLLGMAIARAVGQPLARYAQQRLWQPLGMQHDASWSLDSHASGVERAFCCLNARAVDYLRLGQLVLQEGLWNGQRIVSAAWLRQSTAALAGLPGADDAAQRNVERFNTPQAAFYGWQWRRRPAPGGAAAVSGGAVSVSNSAALAPGEMVYAQGLHGQFLLIDPQSQTVVLRLGQQTGQRFWPGWLDRWVRLNAPPPSAPPPPQALPQSTP